LVIQGHEHAYARTCPYEHGRCVEDQRIAVPPASSFHSNSPSSSAHLTSSSHSRKVLLGRRATESWGGNLAPTTEHVIKPDASREVQEQAFKHRNQDLPQQQQQQQQQQQESVCNNRYAGPAGAPIYMLSGNAGAGVSCVLS